MSKSLRSEDDRQLVELEALVAGMSAELNRVYKKLDACENKLAELILALQKGTK